MKHSWHDVHVIQSAQSLVKVLYKTLGIFVAFFVLFHLGSSLYAANLLNKQTQLFEHAISLEKAYIKQHVFVVSGNSDIQEALIGGNHASLLEILSAEKSKLPISSMALADKEGVILGRTLTKGKYGDNVFLTLPIGRAVAQGKTIESIEITSFGDQLSIVAARPIIHEGNMIGALFAGNLLDNQFAKSFKEHYLTGGTEVAFYTKPYGIYGSSFIDSDTNELIRSYFNTGSEWVKDGLSEKTITFDDGTSYIVKNIIFPGLEQSPGGALLFIPRLDSTTLSNHVTAIATLIAFLVLALSLHFSKKGEEKGWRYCTMLIGASLLVFTLSFIAFYSRDVGYLRLEKISYTLYNSTLRLEPESGIYNIGFEQHLKVKVDVGDELINVVQLKLHYDPTKIQVLSISDEDTICAYIVEKQIDPENGTISYTCGILDLSTGQRSVTVADILVLPLQKGTFEIGFDNKETRVLASDGLGTNVLRTSQNGSYRVDAFGMSLYHSSTTEMERAFMVYSPSHPNESRWYNSSQVRFVWLGPTDAVYRYVFDSSADTVPNNGTVVQGNQIELAIPGNGIYYFHLQLASGGPVAHYRIRADMTPPTVLEMNLSQRHIVAGDVVRFSFNAEDPVSGVQKNYYVDLGNHLYLPIGQELFIPFLDEGTQKVTLRVYDVAGNYSEKTEIIEVFSK